MKLVVSTIEGAQQSARDVVDRVFVRALVLVGAVFAGVAAIIFLRKKRKA
jgi:LPXTG-motif cell wall-anchored protein